MISTAISAIEAMISPVVLITASAVVGAGLVSMFGMVNERVRSMTRERVSLRAGEDSQLTRERIAEIDTQLGWLLDRHRLLSRAVRFTYAAPAPLTLSVIVIAIGVGTHSDGLGIAADVLVVAGALTLLTGLWYAARSSIRSENAIEYEVKRVRSLLAAGVHVLDHQRLPCGWLRGSRIWGPLVPVPRPSRSLNSLGHASLDSSSAQCRLPVVGITA